MQVNVGGVWTEWPDETAAVLPFDDTLAANPAGLGDNRGCPPGYFCEYVFPGWWSSAAYARRCRLLDRQIATDGGVTLEAETGPGLVDQTVIAMADASRTVVAAVTPVFTTGLLLVGAALLGVLWIGSRR